MKRFPGRSLATGILLTLALVGVASYNMWSAQRSLETFAATDIELVRLGGRIVHLDEVLTMSARMNTATGDHSWEKRYLQFEPELDAAIKEFIRLDPDALSSTATDDANLALVDMERRSFELIRAGKREEAARTLFSEEYEKQKKIYAEGTRKTLEESHQRVVENMRALNAQIVFATLIDLLMLAFLATRGTL